MTRNQFFAAYDLARRPDFEPLPYLGPEMVAVFSAPVERGGRRPVTLKQAASQIVGEAMTLAGVFSISELERLQAEARKWELVAQPCPHCGREGGAA